MAVKLGYQRPIYQVGDTSNEKSNLLHNFYGILKAVQFKPNHIVDVGANRGDWTREALKEFPDCRFTLLEPQAHMKESIKDILESNSRVSFNAVGAGKQSGIFKFTIVDRHDSCSFVYSDEDVKKHGYKQVEVPVVTLNELITEQNLPVPDIIKIDAEGLDIDVLEGSSDFFGKTEIFMIEAGVVNKIFENSFLGVINFMDKKNYRLFEITDINREYLRQGKLKVSIMDRGTAWLDTGTFDSLMQASQFVQVIEQRQGIKIACIEEIAYRKKFITKEQVEAMAQPLLKSGYGQYLINVINHS